MLTYNYSLISKIFEIWERNVDILIFLDEVSAKLNSCEENAKKSISEGNNDAYIKIMQQKAEIIAELPLDIKKYDESDIPAPVRKFISDRTSSFSASAKKAIELKSNWYMSQLLFNEDHQDGNPNNFDLFVQEVKKMS